MDRAQRDLIRMDCIFGSVPSGEPTYRVMRRLAGYWPFRRPEYMVECVETSARMTMSREAFDFFVEHYADSIVSVEL